MLHHLVKRITKTKVQPGVAELPDMTRVYAVGDIHGRADLLKQMHDLIELDAEKVPSTVEKIIVYLGDYVDRGPESRKVLDILISHPLTDFRTVFLCGNHDRMMLDFMHSAGVATLWARHGGLETLASYGFFPSFDDLGSASYIEDLRERFSSEVPFIHKAFLENLRLHYSTGGYYFVHAGINPNLPLAHQMQHDALWMREPFLSSAKKFEKIIVHGHTPVQAPQAYSNRISVDTGACMTNKLSCAVLDGYSVQFIQTY